MEASGVADATWTNTVGYLVVRGICDYCDTYKMIYGKNTRHWLQQRIPVP